MTLGPDGRLRELTYRIDPDRFLQVQPDSARARNGASAGRPAPRFTTEVVTYRREVALVAIRGDVDRDHPSLVAALERAGEDVGLAVGIAELFGGDVDFYRDLQPGDVIEVVFEQVLRDGARIGYGDIVAARLTNAGRLLSAFRFQPGGGHPAYYDAAGLSLKRFFLASPLKFEPRVTSGFSYRRLHPVLGIRRPHLGADFGAPTGAPVVATADAAVVSARYSAGGGNTVHASPCRRLREPLPAPVGVRGRRPGRGARVAGPGDRPRRRDRAGDRARTCTTSCSATAPTSIR